MRLLPLLCAACGASKTPLVELDADQIEKICSDLQGERTYLCENEDGLLIQFTVGGDCVERNSALPADCGATVRDLRDCDEAQTKLYEEDPCATEVPEPCAALDSCYLDVL